MSGGHLESEGAWSATWEPSESGFKIYMKQEKVRTPRKGVLFYIRICVSIIPQTHGSPNIPLPPTVYQFSGINTPVNFWVKFIKAIAANPNNAFERTDFISR